ncbi:cystatin-like [Antechinus flavipes]|uniref:cystatin-like n=1 Tax=Antechinus flavipes TaxID=38775 RepID=UPI002235F660|nr:cystatin-like [Antechinus flavipes]
MAGPRSFLLLPLLLLALVVAAHAERIPRLLGGLSEANVNDENVKRALNFAISEFNRATNDKYGSRLVRVLEAKKQLVAGMKYIFKVEIGRTTCTKSVADFSNCPDHKEPPLKKHSICDFEVHTVPWMGKSNLVKSECRNI